MLDVVVVNFHSAPLIARTAAVARGFGGETAHLILVDNSPLDGAADVLRAADPGATIITNRVNRGYAVAVNQAVAASAADTVLLLNPDVEQISGAFATSWTRFAIRVRGRRHPVARCRRQPGSELFSGAAPVRPDPGGPGARRAVPRMAAAAPLPHAGLGLSLRAAGGRCQRRVCSCAVPRSPTWGRSTSGSWSTTRRPTGCCGQSGEDGDGVRSHGRSGARVGRKLPGRAVAALAPSSRTSIGTRASTSDDGEHRAPVRPRHARRGARGETHGRRRPRAAGGAVDRIRVHVGRAPHPASAGEARVDDVESLGAVPAGDGTSLPHEPAMSSRQRTGCARGGDGWRRPPAARGAGQARRGAHRHRSVAGVAAARVAVLRFAGHGPSDQLGPVSAPLTDPDAAAAVQSAIAEIPLRRFVLLAELVLATTDSPGGWAGGGSTRTSLHSWVSTAHRGTSPARARRQLRAAVRRLPRKLAEARDVSVRLASDPSALDGISTRSSHSTGGGGREPRRPSFAWRASTASWLRVRSCAGGFGSGSWRSADGRRRRSTAFATRAPRRPTRAGGPAFARHPLGFIMISHAVREAHADGMREYHLLRGGERIQATVHDVDQVVETSALARGVDARLLRRPRKPREADHWGCEAGSSTVRERPHPILRPGFGLALDTLAGLPTTIECGATSRVTTAPAPTSAPAPIRMPPRITAPSRSRLCARPCRLGVPVFRGLRLAGVRRCARAAGR